MLMLSNKVVMDIIDGFLERLDAVILIDAVHSGTKPGTIHRLDAHTQPIPAKFFITLHTPLGVAEAIELVKALKQLPPLFIVYGIEGKCFEAGNGLSLRLIKAAQESFNSCAALYPKRITTEDSEYHEIK